MAHCCFMLIFDLHKKYIINSVKYLPKKMEMVYLGFHIKKDYTVKNKLKPEEISIIL